MTRYQMKKQKTKQKRKLMISIGLIVVGLAMVITALVMEASHYPWGLLFGTATQNDESLADPAPIVLDEEDQGAQVTIEASPSEEPTETPVTSTPEDSEPSPSIDLPGNETDTQNAPAVSKYVVLGTLKIPVLKVSQNLLEGAGKQMKYGVGHVPGTAMPGQPGNCAIAGHRPYPFRYLDQLKTGDSIVIKAGGIKYTYAVFDNFDVLPNEVWVLNRVPGEDYTLTLITCTPYMVSSHRLIIRARLVDIDGQTPQDYYGIPAADTTDSESTDASPEVTSAPDASLTPTDATAETTEPVETETPTPSSSELPSALPTAVPTEMPAAVTTPSVPETSQSLSETVSPTT